MSTRVAIRFNPEPRVRFRDNPILIAQAQRRLKPSQFIPTLAVAGISATCALIFAVATNDASAPKTLTLGYLIAIQVALLLRGSVSVANALVADAASGVLEFHRVTPTSSPTDALGYIFGAPAREYLVAATLLPFTVVAGTWAQLPLVPFLEALVATATTAFVFHAIAALTALVAPKRANAAAGVVFFGITAYALGAALSEVGVPLLAHLTTYPSLERLFSDSGAADPIVFVGAPIPSFLFTVAVDTCAFGFALHGCTRKLANPARPATSRFGAIGLFVIAVVLGIGSSWTAAEDAVGASGSAIVLSYLLGSALVAMLTSGALVPSYLAVTRGIRRARRRGDHVGWFDDQGAGWPLALGFSVVVSGGFGMLAFAMRRGFASDHLVSMNMVWAVLSVATLILLLTSTVEFLRLCRRKSLGGSALLIGFALTVFPLLLMGIFSALKIDSAERYAAALSPLFGLLATAVRAASVWSIDYEAPPFAADGAAVLFSHVVAVAVIVFFQIQVTLVRRRLTLSLGPR